MSKRDYYVILGVERDAAEAELKKAYRTLALQYHPDRNADDAQAEERFKELSEAYAVLSDPQKRRRYDQFGHAGLGGAAGGPGPDFGDLGGFGDVFNDLFGDIFGASGGRRRRGRGQRGADLRYNLELDLENVLDGLEANLEIPKMRSCETCTGSGARPGTKSETCGRCQGSGQLMFQQGFFRVNRPCDACEGAGELIRDRCRDCRGAGRVEGLQSLKVTIPIGVDDGTRLRLVGEGEAGISGGEPGDLYVVISVRSHTLFERDGTDLHCEVPVQFVQAALGAEIEVPTLEGKVQMQIPEGTQSGTILRLRGKGIPPCQPRADKDQLMRMRGELFVRIFVEIPTKLNERQRELLEEFAEASDTEVSPAAKGFLDKLRDLFD
ncbi:MAG: molecular chaperone DnaJ [Deltaproteobacteria bacterium]|nr:molecular chaperone DnaJ [Deltaproteobacteria bacterium]MBW2416972.1 molecular chaperone DnaJ [Deltaproteobacteria bacterium]